MKFPLPSETTARNHVYGIYVQHRSELEKYFRDAKVFIIFDKSEIKREKYINIIAGKMTKEKVFLFSN